jgi:gliding motility-associated-like protein
MTRYKRIVLLITFLLGAIPALSQCTLSVTISASNGGVICSGNNIVLTANASGGTAPYSYLWSTSETTSSITVNKGITYTVTVSDNSACPSVKESITITAVSAPPAPTAAGAIVCKGSTATLTATAPGGTYQWYDVNGNFLFTGDTYITPAITASTTFYVDATVGGCTGPKTPVVVDITADPTVTGANICAGNQATLTASGGDSYKWYDAPNGNEVAQGPTYSPTLTQTTTFYVVAVTNGCTSNPVPVTANVTPYPQTPVPVQTNFTICAGTSANLHADVGDGGTIAWYDVPSGGQPLIISPDYTTPNLTGTTTYYAQNSFGTCESPRTAVTITVTPAPDAPTVTPSPATTCSGTSAVLTASSPSGTNFAWFADAAGTTPLPNNTANPFVTPILTATTTYYVQTINGSCFSGLIPVTITVTDNPAAPTVAPVTQVCPGTAATLSAIAPGGTYSWYDAATGGNLLFTGDTFTPIVSANTTYYVQVANANGCVSTRTAVNVTTLPTVTPPTVNPATVCYSTATTLTATGSDNYQWYDAPTGGNLLSSSDTYTTPALTTSTIYYVETTVNGCTSLRTAVTVTVNPIPQQPTVSGATTICPLTSTTLTASVTDGGTIRWYNVATGGTVLATGNTYTPTVNATTTYYAENTLGTCVGPRAGVTVTTSPVTFPQFQYPSATVCSTTSTFTPQINEPAGGTFSASPGTLAINSTTGQINVASSPLGKYTITFKSNNSCQTITSTTISIVVTPDATFTYTGGPYCQFTTNPAPVFSGTASAGIFTATPSGLVFVDPASGVIDLQNSQPGTYTVTNTIAASGTCTATSAQQTVIINPGVDVNAGPDQAIKASAIAQLAGTVTPTGTAVKWTGGTASGFSDPTNPTATYTPTAAEVAAGSVMLTLSIASGNTCGTITDQVVITISPKPAPPTVAPPPAVCAGSTVTLVATGGGNYDWFTVATGGTKVFTGSTFTTPPLSSSTTYWVQTTVGVNTSDRTQVDITVNPLPLAPEAPAVATCFNTPAVLKVKAIPGNTYEWYAVASGGTALTTGDTYTTPALTGPASYYVQAISNGCPGPRAKVDVTIIQPPTVTSAQTGQVCSGSLLSYTITSSDAAATYSWDRPAVAGITNATANGNTSSISETLVNTGNTPIKVTYNITVTVGACSTLFKYVVTVNPLGSVTSASTSGPVCNGEPINYAFAFTHSGVSFRWSRAAVTGISNLPVSDQAAAIIKESLFNTTNAPVDVTYVFTYLEGSCTGTFNLVVTVNPAITVSSIQNTNACSGLPVNYTITSNIPSATFSWYRAAAGPNPAVNNQTSNPINEIIVNDGSFDYVVYDIIPYAFGCQGTPFFVVVHIKPVPGAPAVNSNSPVCAEKTIYLQTPTVTGATYSWTGPNGFTSNQQNPQINNVTQANAGNYSLIITTSCSSPPTTVNVEIKDKPIVTAGPDQTVCVTQNAINITGTVGGGTTTGIWTTNGTGTFSPSAGQANTQYIPTAQDKANGTVILTLTSTSKDDCDPALANTVITFGPTPAVDAGPDQEVCAQNTNVALNGTLVKPGSATWATSGTGTFSPSTTQVNASYVPSAADITSGSVTLTLTYNNASVCDIPTDEMTIKFNPPPTVYAGGTRYVLKDHTIVLQPTVSNENVTYLWTPNIGINDNTLKNPVITGGDNDQLYTLTITDALGCTAQDQALVKVSPVILVNNTFTPNGDGVNDLWNITGLSAYPDVVVDVYNRYGLGMYHSIGYSKPWDGSYNGQPLPAATYYYVIRLNVSGQVLSGSITIIR